MQNNHAQSAELSWQALVRPAIAALTPFASARATMGGGKAEIYVDANESPFAEIGNYNRYPDPQPADLLEALADLYGVAAEQVFISLGSDVGIDSLMRVFCEARQNAVVITPPTFAMYGIWAAIQGAEVVRVPLLGEDLQLDSEGVLNAWTPACRLLFVCTPNNPMGTTLRREDLLILTEKLKGRGIVVVDEAYQEFVDTPSLSAALSQHDNLVVLHTLSKAYGAAGARCGAVLAHEELVRLLRKVMAPYPFPSPSKDIILERLQPAGKARAATQVAMIKQQRERLRAALQTHPEIIKIYPSAANFLCLIVRDVPAFMQRLRDAGIVARDRRSDWPNAIRLTIGTPEENTKILAALGL